MSTQWTLQDAKNKFSEVVNAACAGAPQVVARRGRPTAVVLSMHDYEHFLECSKAPAPSFAEFLLAMPKEEEAEETAPRQGIALWTIYENHFAEKRRFWFVPGGYATAPGSRLT